MIKTKLFKQVGEVSFKNDKIYPNKLILTSRMNSFGRYGRQIN